MLTSACGVSPAESTPATLDYVASDLAPDLYLYLHEMRERGIMLPFPPAIVEWAEIRERQMLGVTYPSERRVQLDVSLREYPQDVRSVLHHELTHCYFNLAAHDPEPGHIMSASGFVGATNWTDLEWEQEWDRLAQFIKSRSWIYAHWSAR